MRPDPFVDIASISTNSKAINESDDELNVAAEEYDLDTSEHRKTSLLQICRQTDVTATGVNTLVDLTEEYCVLNLVSQNQGTFPRSVN